jgi:hypothetical protein
MLIIREGEVRLGPAPASRRGVRSCVMVKTRVRFRVRTRVQALSGNWVVLDRRLIDWERLYTSLYGAPQLLPELLTKTSNFDSLLESSVASLLQSSSL